GTSTLFRDHLNMTTEFKIISPIDGQPVASVTQHTLKDAEQAIAQANKAQKEWAVLTIAQRKLYIEKFMQAVKAERENIGRDITLQMGRPIRYTPFEADRVVERTEYMLSVA